jgi:hypothetical protein
VTGDRPSALVATAPEASAPLATPGSPSATKAPPDPRRRERAPGIRLDCRASTDVPHVGIVFVHGIGSQAPGETLQDWGGAIVRALLDARVRHHASADPVIDVELDPGPSDSRFIEVQLPEVIDQKIPEQHWVMTEAWWAGRVRPPTFGQMADWLGTGGAIERIVDSLIARRHDVNDPRLRSNVEVRSLQQGPYGVEEAPDLKNGLTPARTDGSRWSASWQTAAKLRGQVGALWSGLWRWVAVGGGKLYLRAVSALVLVLYGLLRTIEKLLPIGPLKDGALTRPLDSFVLDWFGDVYVLLDDAPQAASIRGRLLDAIADLKAAGCGEVTIVAHSGGAIVSYMTLADPTRTPPVDRLITLGEGLNLAWRLVPGPSPAFSAVESDRLSLNILTNHPGLEWHDFWASQDPAPVGVLAFSPLATPDKESLRRVKSHAIWNRLSFAEDHGGYWDNDEEFLIPILRLLEGRPDGPSLFGYEAPGKTQPDRSNLRRQRLSMLSLLRQACVVAPMAGILCAFAVASRTAFDVSDAIAKAWNWIPGTRFASDALDYVRGLRPQDGDVVRFFAETGVWVVAAAIAGTTAFSLLAPPERPLPWLDRGRAASVVGFGLRILPYLVGIPVVAVLVYGAARFLSGSTISALDVGNKLAIGIGAGLLLLVGLRLVLGQWAGRSTGFTYAASVLFVVLSMVLVCGLVVAPVVAAIVFPDVGRMIVGSLVIVLVFQGVGRVGGWRWTVWDVRERRAARTADPYHAFGRVVSQIGLLAVILAAAFVAVMFDSIVAAAVAGVALAMLVLVGVAIDVLDAAHQEAKRPRGQTPDPLRV